MAKLLRLWNINVRSVESECACVTVINFHNVDNDFPGFPINKNGLFMPDVVIQTPLDAIYVYVKQGRRWRRIWAIILMQDNQECSGNSC